MKTNDAQCHSTHFLCTQHVQSPLSSGVHHQTILVSKTNAAENDAPLCGAILCWVQDWPTNGVRRGISAFFFPSQFIN